MTASERLRELSELYNMGIAEAGDRYGPDVEYRSEVVRVLPLIADVVEAAEAVDVEHADVWPPHESWQDGAAKCHRALTALRDSLENP